MRSAPLLAVLFSTICLLPACDGAVECAIDTDCAPGLYCSLVGSCLERGVSSGTDTGSRDVGMPSDAPPRDTPVGDAPAGDAPVRDAPMSSDAPVDGAADACPGVDGTYMLTSVGVACTGLGASTMTLTGPAPSECAFEVMLDTASVGAVALMSRTSFMGTLNIAGTPTPCTLAFSMDLTMVNATCGACIFAATAR